MIGKSYLHLFKIYLKRVNIYIYLKMDLKKILSLEEMVLSFDLFPQDDISSF